MSKLKPIGDKLIIKQVKQEAQTKAGIFLAPDAQEKQSIGEVIAVGPGKHHDGKIIPLDVKKGDKIAYSKYGPTELKIEGEEYLVLSESDVLCVIE
jgi:chaperonin GroES